MNKDDLTGTYSADGYTVFYKGKFVCGASVKLPRERPLHYRHRQANEVENKRQIGYAKQRIIDGLYADRIRQIDDEENQK